ncbi:MAG: DnaJ C-terminal domain-containing protein, partial [bacterium]|nr:DnaJ C-terminal domain-containing protein [bacterium]
VLIDPQKKSMYDQYGYEGVSQQFGQQGFRWENFSHYDDISDIFGDLFGHARGGGGSGGSIFDAFFGQGGQREHSVEKKGSDIKIVLKLTLREMYTGAEKTIKYHRFEKCPTCGGAGGAKGDLKKCPDCSGTGQRKYKTQSIFGTMMQVAVCPTCQGDGTIIEKKCKDCYGDGRIKKEHTVKISAPAGVFDNAYMRMEREGNIGRRGGTNGDLIIVFQQIEDEKFKREENNLTTDIIITYPKAVLGSEEDIEGIDGKTLKLKIPEGTQSGKVFVLKGKGMPELHSNRHGDLYVRIIVDVPRKIDQKTRNLIKELDKNLKLKP